MLVLARRRHPMCRILATYASWAAQPLPLSLPLPLPLPSILLGRLSATAVPLLLRRQLAILRINRIVRLSLSLTLSHSHSHSRSLVCVCRSTTPTPTVATA